MNTRATTFTTNVVNDLHHTTVVNPVDPIGRVVAIADLNETLMLARSDGDHPITQLASKESCVFSYYCREEIDRISFRTGVKPRAN